MAEGMQLSAFLTQTIMAVIQGVRQAQLENRSLSSNAVINPVFIHAKYSDARNIDFDIAVAVTASSTGLDGGLELSVPLVNASINPGEKSKAEMSNTSRVTFSVPIAFPSTPEEQYPSSHSTRSSYLDDDS